VDGRGGDDTTSAQKLIKAEQELAAANRDVEIAADVAKINERTTATERLTAATLKGSEAVRQAALQNKLAEIAREGDTLAPGLIGIGQRGIAAAGEAQADHARLRSNCATWRSSAFRLQRTKR